jgi:hypothetical protein
MTFDVFISYPHQDKAMADATCATLEAEGIRCWIAPRDISPSADWATSIVDAIDNCRVMILIFSGHTNRSKQIGREVQQAFEKDKPVIPFRIENVAPEKSLRYYMGPVHWLDALTPPVEDHLHRLASTVQALLTATQPDDGTREDRPVAAETREASKPASPHVEETRRLPRTDTPPRFASGALHSPPATRPVARWAWIAAAVSAVVLMSLGALLYAVWWSPLVSAKSYARVGNYACFDKAEYPDAWLKEAPFCLPYGCNFGKMSRDACLALGARKQSTIVIHGNPGSSRADECWLQHTCGDLRPHGEFTQFRM